MQAHRRVVESPGEPQQHRAPCPLPAAEEQLLLVPSGGGKCGFRWQDWEVFHHIPVQRVSGVVWVRHPQMQMFSSGACCSMLWQRDSPHKDCPVHITQARKGKLAATVLQHMGTHTLLLPYQPPPGEILMSGAPELLAVVVGRYFAMHGDDVVAVTTIVRRDHTRLLQTSSRLLSTQTAVMDWNPGVWMNWVRNMQSWKPSELVVIGLLWNVNEIAAVAYVPSCQSCSTAMLPVHSQSC